jgi:dipeptidyl aminopeptidase/acylaminoacyl peptidase
VDGRALTAWVVLPPGPRLPAPAIVWVYGGQDLAGGPPADAWPGGAVTAVFSGQLWAAQGYAVLYPSTPIGRAAETDVGATLAREVIAAIDAAAAEDLVDPARVGIIGHSFGGYSTAAVLAARPDRFRAGVAMSGPYDFAAAWGARYPLESLIDEDGYGFSEETRGYVEAGQIGLGAPPFDRPDAYRSASPFFAARRITTPLLLTVGDQDQGATSLGQAERLYAALARSGNPAVLVRYWGQGHVQQDPWAVRDQWARFTAWFDHYLRPAAPRDAIHPPRWLAAADAARRPGRRPASASSAPRIPSSPRG